MTLKENFEQWFINDEEDEHYEGMVDKVAIEHEKIADEFAIDFGEWLIKKEHEYTNKIIKMKELLEIYKKEKRL
jgi:hypothetical protein